MSINTSWNVYNFRRNLLSFLKDQGYTIIVAAPKDTYSDKLIELGFNYVELEMENKGANPIADYFLYKRYQKLIQQIQPDICLFYTIKPNIYGTLAASGLGVPVINNISGLGTVFLRKNITSLIAKSLYRLALKKSYLAFFQNKDDQEVFISLGLIEAKKTQVIPGSGIDTEYFSPKKIDSRDEKIRFLMVSRLIFDKGILEYIQAAKTIHRNNPNTVFKIVGRAEDEANLGLSRQQISEQMNAGHITWIDEQEDIREEISNADVVVLPSYREGLSRALLEAGSMAKPIIATNVPGCKELVEEGRNGFLCIPKNVESLLSSMEKMISKSPDERIKMGHYGREIVRTGYDQHFIFQAYQNAITNNLK